MLYLPASYTLLLYAILYAVLCISCVNGLFLCCHYQCSWDHPSPATNIFCQYQLLFLSVGGISNAGVCPSMMVSLHQGCPHFFGSRATFKITRFPWKRWDLRLAAVHVNQSVQLPFDWHAQQPIWDHILLCHAIYLHQLCNWHIGHPCSTPSSLLLSSRLHEAFT